MFERNIKLIYWNVILSWGRFFVPVLALFYVASQVTLKEFSIIMAVFALSVLLFEIPGGIIADLLGKKNTLLFAQGFLLIEVLLLATTNGFWFFLIAKIISGIGVSLNSGTDDSFLHDTLKKLKRIDEYKIILGKKHTYGYISQAIVFSVGALLFNINYKLPAYLSLIPLSICLFLIFQLKEPYPTNEKIKMRKSFNHLKEGILNFSKNKTLWFLVFFVIPISFVANITLVFSSVYFTKISIPVALIGVIAFVGSMLIAAGSKYAAKIESYLNPKRLFFLMGLIGVIVILLESFLVDYWGVIFYLVFMFIVGVRMVLISNYAQSQVSQKHRTTMISILNLFRGLGVFIVYLLMGFVIDKYSFQTAYFMMTSLMFIGLLFASYYYYRNKKEIKIK